MKRRLSLGLLLALPGLALWLSTSSQPQRTRPDANPPSHPSIPGHQGAHAEIGGTRVGTAAQVQTPGAPPPSPQTGAASPTQAASGPAPTTAAPDDNKLTPSMLAAINALEAEKASRTPVQLKIDSQLLFADKMRRGVPIAEGVARLEVELEKDAKGRIKVDLKAKVTPEILGAIAAADGEVLDAHEDYEAIRAWLALGSMEEIAGRPDVTFVRPASKAVTNAGSVTSRGYYTHQANVAATQFKATGKGVKVGVLSDSIDGLANAQAKGDLGPVTVLTNRFGKIQDGVPASGEGTAMLEIVHDMAPDAQLFYATAFNGEASFAQNIRDLRFRLGCDIIVDDVGYFRESPFQDDLIAQAVDAVVADGALYFSAAGNSGNKTQATAGTWEGDFVDSGERKDGGEIHRFPSGSSNKALVGGLMGRVDLFWTEPIRKASSDYDVYVFDESNTVVASSNNLQGGSQDPYESIGSFKPGQRVVVVKKSGPARFLHLSTGRGRLMDTTSGNIRGHAAALGALAVAAVDVAKVGPTSPFVSGSKCPVQGFSSDGPRRVFFRADGTPYTPSNFSSTGGTVRQKPDIAAANGVATTLPSDSGLNPFFGTSAAAPHAAAVAALVKSYNPDLTPAQVRSALLTTALDNEQPGVDRNAGYGIVMASAAIRAVGPPIQPSITGFDPVSGAVGQQVQIQGLKLDGVTNVSFGGAAAAYVIQSPSVVVATVPVGAASGPISIRTAALQTNSAAPFTVRTTPVLLSATPSSGDSGTRVTLRGAYLAGTTEVRFNGASASFSQVSGDELSALVPPNATSGRITAVTPNGTATNATVFTVLAAPVITGFTPDRGGIGTRVVVTGANLGTITAASIGGMAAPFVIDNANQVTLTVPQGAATGTLSVTSAQGTATSSQAFTVLPTPVIALVFPTAAPVGDPVFLLGTNLLAATDVQFNGRPTDFFALDEGLIVALVPPDATTGPVTVASPSGIGTSPTSFVVVPPPSNDRFATPIVLTGTSGSITNSNVAATKEAGEANHAGNRGGRSIWYQWTAPADGVWRFDTAGSTNDTLLAVYSGPSLTTLTNLASNDDASAALSTSRVLFPVTKDVTYRIAVDGFNTGDGPARDASSGTLKLNWGVEALAPQVTALSTNRARVGEIVVLFGVNLVNSPEVTFNGVRAVVSVGRRAIYATVPPGNVSGDVVVTTTGGTSKAPVPFTLIVPPANDAFANAKEYGVANGFSGFTNLDATRETGEPLHAESGTNSVWFRWTAPRSGLFVFETVNCSFDTVLAIYTGGAVGSLTKVAEDDDAGALVTSRVLLQATAGVAYSIAIAGAEGAAGSGALRWSEVAGRPVISDFTPLDGGISSWVTILGANFTNVTSVSLGRVKAYYVVDSPGRIRARIPNASTNGILTVVTGMGSASSPGIFRVTDAPGNDDFDSREVITGSYLVWQYNNAKATREEGEPLHAGIPGGKSLWYEWRVPTSGYWAIDTSNTSFDTALAVYTGLNRTNLTLFASNDDFGSRSFSRVEFYAAANTLLEIAIDGFSGAAGEGFLRVQPTVNDIEVVDYDFGVAEGFRTTTSLGGQVGWTATSTRGNGIVTGFFAASPQQAFVGYDGNGVEVKKPLGIIPGGSRPVVRFDVDFAIYDSTNSEYDDFKFRFYNRAGQRLFTLGFSNYYREMYYVPNYDGATTQWLPTKIRNAQIYHLTVVMDFVANRWSAYLDGNDVVLDKYISWNGSQLDLDSVAVVWSPSNASVPGNNYMVFDNYRVTSMAPIRPVVAGLTWSHSITAGAGTVLVAVADGTPPFQYQWYHDGSPVLGGNGPLLWLSHAEVADAGSYTVRISNGYGTTTSSGIQLTVVPLGLAMESPDTLRVTCAPSQRVRVEVSSDLKTWATLVSQAAGPDGVLRAKTSVGTVSHAFYRVVLE